MARPSICFDICHLERIILLLFIFMFTQRWLKYLNLTEAIGVWIDFEYYLWQREKLLIEGLDCSSFIYENVDTILQTIPDAAPLTMLLKVIKSPMNSRSGSKFPLQI